MSKNRLSVIAAVALIVFSVAVFVGRQVTFGPDSDRPPGASSWKVTLVATGELPVRATTVTTRRARCRKLVSPGVVGFEGR